MNFVAWDTETHLIQPGLLSPPIVCHSFAYPDEEPQLLDREIGGNLIDEWLHTDVVVAGANIAYDFGCLLAERPWLLDAVFKMYDEGRVHDVLIFATLNAIAEGRLHDGELFARDGSKMKDPAKGTITNRYSLAVTTYEWLGRKDAKHNDEYRLSYASLENTPINLWPVVAQQYPKDDAVNTLECCLAQRRGLGSGMVAEQARQADAAFCAHLAAMWGLRTDGERVDALETDLLARHAALKSWAVEQGFVRPEGVKGKKAGSKDTALLASRVSASYKGSPPVTETGKVSISREALEESGDPALEKFAEIGKVEKLMTYLPTLKEAAKVPLNVKPNILLASGRASYEGMIQLLPRKGGVRDCFKFRGVGCSVDYSAVELVTLGEVCIQKVGFSDLADAINRGVDPHSLFGARLISAQYDAFKAASKVAGSIEANVRQAAKAANFGFPGMMGAPKFVIAKRREGASVCEWLYRDGRCGERKIVEWNDRPIGAALCERCVTESNDLRNQYLLMWKEIRPYWKKIEMELEASGDDSIVHLVSGRKRGGLRAPQAANSYFQGLAADGAKAALRRMTREMYLDKESALYGSRLAVFAHDETIIDIPHEDPHDAAVQQARVMVEEMQRYTPHVKVTAEPALMRYWYKEAQPVFNEKGRLIPWEPAQKAA